MSSALISFSVVFSRFCFLHLFYLFFWFRSLSVCSLDCFFFFGSGHYLLFVGCRWQRLNLLSSSVSTETGTGLRVRVVSHLPIEMLQIDFRCRLRERKRQAKHCQIFYFNLFGE